MELTDSPTISEIVRCTDPYSHITFRERLTLGRLASRIEAPHAIVEIGTFEGGTATILRRFAPDTEIFSIDMAPADHAYRVALEHNIHLICSDSSSAAQQVERSAGLLFIDAGHDLEDVLNDWNAWAPKCENAWVAFHDCSPPYPGILTLVNTLIRSGRIAEAGTADFLVYGKIADPSPPSNAELENTMDLVAESYRNFARAIPAVNSAVDNISGRIHLDVRDIPFRIVGTGARGAKTAGLLNVGIQTCINSADATDPDTLYIIAGSPGREIKKQLLENGIPADHIIDHEMVEYCGPIIDQTILRHFPFKGELSRTLSRKFQEAFRDAPEALLRYHILDNSVLPILPYYPPCI